MRVPGGDGKGLSCSYDARGHLIQVTDGNGACTRYMYNVRGDRIREEQVISEGGPRPARDWQTVKNPISTMGRRDSFPVSPAPGAGRKAESCRATAITAGAR